MPPPPSSTSWPKTARSSCGRGSLVLDGARGNIRPTISPCETAPTTRTRSSIRRGRKRGDREHRRDLRVHAVALGGRLPAPRGAVFRLAARHSTSGWPTSTGRTRLLHPGRSPTSASASRRGRRKKSGAGPASDSATSPSPSSPSCIKKIRFYDRDSIGFGKVDLPPCRSRRAACGFRPRSSALHAVRSAGRSPPKGCWALPTSLGEVIGPLAMCDPHDVGTVVDSSNTGVPTALRLRPLPGRRGFRGQRIRAG